MKALLCLSCWNDFCDNLGGATRPTEVLELSKVCQILSLTLPPPCASSPFLRGIYKPSAVIFCLPAPRPRQGEAGGGEIEVELSWGCLWTGLHPACLESFSTGSLSTWRFSSKPPWSESRKHFRVSSTPWRLCPLTCRVKRSRGLWWPVGRCCLSLCCHPRLPPRLCFDLPPCTHGLF